MVEPDCGVNLDPSCRVSTVQAAAGVTLDLLTPPECGLKSTVYLSVTWVASLYGHSLHILSTHVIWSCFHQHEFRVLWSPPQSPDLIKRRLSAWMCSWQTCSSWLMISCHHESLFPAPRWIHDAKNSGCRGVKGGPANLSATRFSFTVIIEDCTMTTQTNIRY